MRIAGEDRLSWLHSLTTQDLQHLEPGVAAQALVLSPQGHIEHHLTLADDGTAIWAHVEPGTAGPLLAFLGSMRFLLRVDLADVTSDFAVLTLMGPERPAAAPDGTVAAMPDAFGMDVVVPRDRLTEITAAVAGGGARVAGLAAYEALRIAAHRPRFGLDTDHKTLPHEVGWIETAVHLNKGCYRGQETVARVHNLGHPPRRLILLHLDGSEDRLPVHGDPVSRDDAVVGFVGFRGAALRARPGRARPDQAHGAGRRTAAGRWRARGPGGRGPAGRGREREHHTQAAQRARASR